MENRFRRRRKLAEIRFSSFEGNFVGFFHLDVDLRNFMKKLKQKIKKFGAMVDEWHFGLKLDNLWKFYSINNWET